jgi:hypothetical protein
MNHYTAQKNVQHDYQNWKLSQLILKEIADFLASKAKFQHVKAGLENTLMNTLGDHQAHGVELFQKIDQHYMSSGFSYADISLDDSEYSSCLDIITTVIDEHFKDIQTPSEVSSSPDTLSIDDFELKRNQYIDKAYHFVNSKTDDAAATNAILRSALRYGSIYAETRHIGPPQKVYDLFYKWGVQNEGFASPFNARLLGKPKAQFYSLFEDTDEIFGSGGSFFNLNRPENPGHWCLDPPFTSELMIKVDSILASWLKTYKDLSFLLIIPQSHTPSNKPDETVTLKKDLHYYEGLEGILKPLPVNVCIHRYGNIEGFSSDAIIEGYSK